MPVYRLPWNREEQIRVCVALKNCGFVTMSEKDEASEIERELQIMHKELTESQKAFLEKMIERHGSSIEI
tara:strand:- start:55 stop:264 length:210 start_codon:yes stop_codon:yes gene_type:complete